MLRAYDSNDQDVIQYKFEFADPDSASDKDCDSVLVLDNACIPRWDAKNKCFQPGWTSRGQELLEELDFE